MLSLVEIGKRYKYEWIFKNISYEFNKNQSYAITGSNGSGKSTLLKVISGIISPSEGTLHLEKNDSKISHEQLNHHVAVVAPYLELINELTLNEFINFHCKMLGLDTETKEGIKGDLPFKKGVFNRKLNDFSSGMKQRVKLISAISSNREILLLDEPTMNLDSKGIDWYHQQINKSSSSIKIVCSNQEYEYNFCKNVIQIEDYHLKK